MRNLEQFSKKAAHKVNDSSMLIKYGKPHFSCESAKPLIMTVAFPWLMIFLTIMRCAGVELYVLSDSLLKIFRKRSIHTSVVFNFPMSVKPFIFCADRLSYYFRIMLVLLSA